MVPTIPIENLYYLLSYAWDHYAEGDDVDVSSDKCPDVPNLLGMVLANGIRRLSRTGFDRQYVPQREITSRLRGRILVAESYRCRTHRRAQLECEFDELDGDTPANRILQSTCDRLLRLPALTPEIRHEVRLAKALLPAATPVNVTDAAFHRIQLNRNTRRYRLLLSVCALIHRGLLPEERQGARRFRDILRDEVTMHRLFERFVLNFARRHCPGANVRAMSINWVGEWDSVAAQVLPKMITDVTVEWPGRKLILDCKFYKDAMVTRNECHRLHSGHLYQLNAYLQNKAHEPGWEKAEGVLLYPAANHKLDVRLQLLGHRIRIISLDLDRHWSEIKSGLVSILGPVPDLSSAISRMA